MLTSVLSWFPLTAASQAKVIEKAPDHYVLKHVASSHLPPDALWERLVRPDLWWHSDHTYSGDAGNLSLDVQAGGLWREDWAGGSVKHGEVIFVQHGNTLRLDAPFGPLQELGVTSIWTISLIPENSGTKVIFDQVVNGTKSSKLDDVAADDDFVKSSAIRLLVSVK